MNSLSARLLLWVVCLVLLGAGAGVSENKKGNAYRYHLIYTGQTEGAWGPCG